MSQINLANMVLNDINVDAITNSKGTGVFDRLMKSVNANIDIQYLDNRITGKDYATVYLGSIQAVLAQSMQFVLQEQLSEAQISAILKDNQLKDEQIAATIIDKNIKQYELSNTLPAQLIKVQEETTLVHVGIVEKDKQAAKLGLDNVMKNSEASRTANSTFIYVPQYK